MHWRKELTHGFYMFKEIMTWIGHIELTHGFYMFKEILAWIGHKELTHGFYMFKEIVTLDIFFGNFTHF